MTWQLFGTLMGVAGFILSLFNAAANVRLRTIGNQATMLSELRPLLDGVRREFIALRENLGFDRYDVSTGSVKIPTVPVALDDAINKIPDLSGQLLSPSKERIDFLVDTIRQAREEWRILHAKLENEKIRPDDVMQTHAQLEAYSRTLVRLLAEYVEAVTAINKGKLWPRWKYRDHWAITRKLFRFHAV